VIRAVIVEDEPPARARLRRLLDEDPDVTLVGEFADGDSASGGIAALRPDLVLLDVKLPDCDGLEVLRSLAHSPAVIFVTAYGEHAIDAFDVNAVDFLLKPFDRERFRVALDRAKDWISAFASGGEQPLVLRSGGRAILMSVDQIDWVEARGNYVLVHSAGQAHLHRETMAGMQRSLASRGFVRIHRSTIVNVGRVRAFAHRDHGDLDVSLIDGTVLVLSRRYRSEVETRLGRRL